MSITNFIDELFKGGNSFLTEIIDAISDGNTDQDASFATASKLNISRRNKGFIIDGKRALDLDTSRRNCMVIAGSGMGKSQNHIFTTILKSDSSMVIADNSGELSATKPYLDYTGKKTYIFDLEKRGNVYINPLDGTKGNPVALQKIAKTLMGSVTDKPDFFSISGENCVSIFLEQVVEAEPKIYSNIANAYRLLLEYQADPLVVKLYMSDRAQDATWKKFLALNGNSEKTLKSITSTALSSMAWIGENPVLCDLTSVTNIDIDAFRKIPHVLFIKVSPSDATFYAPMVSLIFSSFYRNAFSQLPKHSDLDIMMILDEFSTIIPGLKSEFPNYIANSRKYKIPQLLVIQSESLLSPFGDLKESILGNCYTKIIYGGQDAKAMDLEKLLGTVTVEDKKTGQKTKQPLMTANQIRELDGEVLILQSGKKPLKTKVTPAYKQSRLRKKMNMPAEPTTQEQAIDYRVQYIDLEPYRKMAQEHREQQKQQNHKKE